MADKPKTHPVRLPNGVIVNNVPIGMTQDDLIEYLRGTPSLMEGWDPASNVNPTVGMHPLERNAAGTGKFVTDAARGTRMLLGRLMPFVPGMDEYVKNLENEQREADWLDKPLTNTLGGQVGYVQGAMLAPMGIVSNSPKLAAAASGLQELLMPAKSLTQNISQGSMGALLGGGSQLGANLLAKGWSMAQASRVMNMPPEQQALVQRALDFGFDLRPSQITGKEWQASLEAVLDRLGHGNVESRAAAQQARVNEITDNAAFGVRGKPVEQPEAGAAAMTGWKQGLGAEEQRLGDAYGNLLRDLEVNLEKSRPGLESVRTQQSRLPEASRAPTATKTLDELLGDPNYQPPSRAPFVRPDVDPQKDDILMAIRKFGGIDPTSEEASALARENPFSGDPRNGHVWVSPQFSGASASGATRRGGFDIDDMAGMLYDAGYLSSRSIDELTDKIADASGGVAHFSMHRDPGLDHVDPLAKAIEDLTAEMRVKNTPPPPKAGFIRDESPVTGDVAQDIRSDYSLKMKEGKGSDPLVFGKMKDAIDVAIRDALPAAKKQQFDAINERYGIYAALEQLSPEQQSSFLARLYRGSDSPDTFYSFLGMAPDGDFKKVATGFLTDVVRKATDETTGNVDVRKLHRVIAGQNPEAMRVFGGEDGQTLTDLGAVGQHVLRDKVKDSGTAKNLFYTGLATGGGGAGGFLGGLLGDDPWDYAKGTAAGAASALLMPRAVAKLYGSDLARKFLTDVTPPAPSGPVVQALREYGTGVPSWMLRGGLQGALDENLMQQRAPDELDFRE